MFILSHWVVQVGQDGVVSTSRQGVNVDPACGRVESGSLSGSDDSDRLPSECPDEVSNRSCAGQKANCVISHCSRGELSLTKDVRAGFFSHLAIGVQCTRRIADRSCFIWARII
jgi:hypothetical protein